ncbi:MAG: chromate efflux transporter [Limisphaerales bacterium]
MSSMKEQKIESETKLPFPTFREALLVWVKIGLLSFGGPTGQIALMHRELVERRRWISDSRFLHALNYCMLLPGPEAQQLAIYIGWLLHRVWGGIVAGALFVIPGAILLWLISFIYVTFGDVPIISAIFYGLKPAVMAIVAAAVIRIGKKALKNEVMWSVSALAFVGIFFFRIPFPAIIFTASLIGLIGGRFFPGKFDITIAHGAKATTDAAISDAVSSKNIPAPSLGGTFATSLLWLAVWFLPVLLVYFWIGPENTLFRQGLFFSKAAVVTFGGAYAVLPYVAQQAVETHNWLSTTQMMDGLGLAETTPGPLILVLQFVGFLGGWQHPGELSPLLAATIGAALTSWMTFVPGFLFIFAGAPYIEKMRGNLRMTTALSAITAAVVGVILNLAVWFAWSVIYRNGQLDWFSITVAFIAFAGMQKFKWDVIPVIIGSALLGVLYQMLLT